MLKNELLPSNAVKPNTYSIDYNMLSDNHLNKISEAIQNEENINENSLISEIPDKFMNLLNSEIFNETEFTNSKQWKKFASWAYFFPNSNLKRKFYNHCNIL